MENNISGLTESNQSVDYKSEFSKTYKCSTNIWKLLTCYEKISLDQMNKKQRELRVKLYKVKFMMRNRDGDQILTKESKLPLYYRSYAELEAFEQSQEAALGLSMQVNLSKL